MLEILHVLFVNALKLHWVSHVDCLWKGIKPHRKNKTCLELTTAQHILPHPPHLPSHTSEWEKRQIRLQ